MYTIEELYSGQAAAVFVLKESENETLFLESLKKKYPQAYKRLLSMIKNTCEHGLIRDETKYKPLSRNIHEFKPEGIRILSFKLPNENREVEIILTEYFKKPAGKKQYKPYIERAEKIAAEVIREYNEGTLIIRKG
ncbi:MAG: hypothetical protein ACM3UR_12360 [Bacteroidota bacterium]|jgi:hypothetical protein|nr:hypothetical protein [Ignavibacteria bacterium]MCU7514611.1 hypothetical protein [Ignavibacteria bacterium]MCU7522353.1 hypothetical protein [Ignavibacteria bacterium]MCU7526495.1 hypothetical protein [Ignavibacteria bacterium]